MSCDAVQEREVLKFQSEMEVVALRLVRLCWALASDVVV